METKAQSIYGLFFEVQPKPGQRQAYFDHVDKLKPVLNQHEGLLWIQRYQSIDVPDLILSHQYWASEAALVTWRRNQEHRYSQTQGIKKIFANYRIRVGPRIWSWSDENHSKELPWDQNSFTKCILTLRKSRDKVVELDDASVALTGRYSSLTSKDQELITYACDSFTEALLAKIFQSGAERADLFLPERDYGLFDRSGAPLADS
ncbi:MAG: antibiotic biosynthesis monooxygenase family protein [Alphaproteobacteria bacterium]